MESNRSITLAIAASTGIGFVLAAMAAGMLGRSGPLLVGGLVLGIGLLTVVGVSLIVQYQMVSRIRRLAHTLARVEKGNYVVRCETGDDEIGALGKVVNTLLGKLTELSVNVIDADRELQWTQDELKLKEQLAEKSHLLESANSQLEGRVRELNLLFSTSRALGTSLELNEVVTAFFQTAVKSLDVDRVALLVYDKSKGGLQVVKAHGFGDLDGQLEGMVFRPGEGASGTVYEKRTMLYLRDLSGDARFLHFRGKVRLKGAALVMPLLTGDQCMGVMLLNREAPDSFSFDDVGLFHVISNQVAVAIANALLYNKTQTLARLDELTGLYNRRMLETRLEMEWERSVRFGSELACAMIDVDHFKVFNDEYGHLVGDDVLRHVGQVIHQHLRKVDTVARYGGEEFAILFPRTGKTEAASVVEKLRQTIEKLPVAEKEGYVGLNITISIGVGSTEDQPESAKQLIDMADSALLMAKTSGRNRVIIYGGEMLASEAGTQAHPRLPFDTQQDRLPSVDTVTVDTKRDTVRMTQEQLREARENLDD